MKPDDWIDHWKERRRDETPAVPADFSSHVLERLDEEQPSRSPATPLLLWICRFGLFVLAAAVMAGRLFATAATLFASTPLP